MRILLSKYQLTFCIDLLFVSRIEGTLDNTGRICGPVLKLPALKKENVFYINSTSVLALHTMNKQTFLETKDTHSVLSSVESWV